MEGKGRLLNISQYIESSNNGILLTLKLVILKIYPNIYAVTENY